MLLLKRIGKILIVYFFVCLCVGILFSFILKWIGVKESFISTALYSISLLLNSDVQGIEIDTNLIKLIVIFISFLGQVCFAIVTSYIITAWLSINKKSIVLSDKLIVRRRTSDGCKNQLTFSVMVANKNKDVLTDVDCKMTCLYYKTENDDSRNNEIFGKDSTLLIRNYRRFSYMYDMLPRRVWEAFLTKNGKNYNDAIVEIVITGKYENSDNEVSVRKKYKISNIVIAKESKKIDVEENVYVWKNMNVIIPYSEKEEKEIIDIIKDYVGKEDDIVPLL